VTTQGIKPGDIVKCDLRGQMFYAVVVTKGEQLEIEPIDRRITYRHVTARQVVAHYRKAKGSK